MSSSRATLLTPKQLAINKIMYDSIMPSDDVFSWRYYRLIVAQPKPINAKTRAKL